MGREIKGYLDGYRVLDLTDFRGMMAGRIMADLGAEVVVVEPPEGLPARHIGSAEGTDSILWSVLSHNKKSVSCNVTTADGRRLLDQLAAAADFVLVSGSQSELEALDLDFPKLAKANPGLIYVTITPFGLSGEKAHYADSDLIIWAASGTLSRNRVGNRVPLRIGAAYQGYYHGASEAVVGALLALAERAVSGQGQHVDVSFQNSMVFSNQLQGLYSLVGDVAAPHSQSVSIFPAIWKTRDGYLQFSLTSGKATGHFSNAFMVWLAEEGALPADFPPIDWRALPQTSGSGLSSSGVTKEKYAEMGVGDDVRARLETIMEHFFLQRDTDELLVVARDRRLLLAPILSVEHIARNEQFRARGAWFGDSQSGDPQPALMGAFASTTPPAFVNRGGPGAPGSANAEILGRWLGMDNATDSIGSAEKLTRRLPLEGVKVADFSWVLAGPSVGRMLADFGATVVRVESLKRVDLARSLSPFTNGQARPDNSALASDVNAGKLGLALDLALPAAQNVARRLTDWADIVIESFSPGTMEKWGLDYARLIETNPDLIMLSTCLLGNSGPFSRMAGFGSAGACMSGIHYMTGWPDLFPTGFSGPYTDFVAPRFSLVGVLAALDRRRRTGEGAYIDLSQTETGLYFIALELADYFKNGRVATRCGNDDIHQAPNNVYACRNGSDGTSRFVAITVRSQAEWTALCKILGLQGIDDLNAAGVAERLRQRRRIDEAIAAATRDLNAEEVEARLQNAGVPAYTVLTSVDLPNDAQLKARNHFIEVTHPRRGSTYVESTRIILSETPGAPRGAGPDVGEHGDYVLRELLGLTGPEIDGLREAGALN